MKQKNTNTYDVIIVGGGIAGLSAAIELLDSNKKVLLIDRDKKENLGGLAKKSFGGILLIDTPEQRRSGIRDSAELALEDWKSYAEFDKQAKLPLQWAEFYCNHSKDLLYPWLKKMKVKFLPVVNWPERGWQVQGNSVPRWHITWGTGFELIRLILLHLEKHSKRKNLTFRFEHQVSTLVLDKGKVSALTGIREDDGQAFTFAAENIILAAGGISGGNLSLVRKHWHKDWGLAPKKLLNGSHIYADGTIHEAAKKIGANLTYLNNHWHYAAGISHPNPEKENDGLSLVPPRSAIWINAKGKRFSPPLVGYTDTRHLVKEISKAPGQYSWQIMNWKIAIKELAVSGSDYMSAFRNKNKLALVRDLLFGNKSLVKRLIKESKDFVVADTLAELVEKMNLLEKDFQVDYNTLAKDIQAYDNEIERGKKYFNDEQLRRILNFRTYKGDRIRTCKFQKIIDSKAGPLIAVRESILARKSLGGIKTDLNCNILSKKEKPIQGLYAIGETAGFGGGGIHGKRSLEGTFLGACILTGRIAAKTIVEKQ